MSKYLTFCLPLLFLCSISWGTLTVPAPEECLRNCEVVVVGRMVSTGNDSWALKIIKKPLKGNFQVGELIPLTTPLPLVEFDFRLAKEMAGDDSILFMGKFDKASQSLQPVYGSVSLSRPFRDFGTNAEWIAFAEKTLKAPSAAATAGTAIPVSAPVAGLSAPIETGHAADQPGVPATAANPRQPLAAVPTTSRVAPTFWMSPWFGIAVSAAVAVLVCLFWAGRKKR
jgi:hypothetical protein